MGQPDRIEEKRWFEPSLITIFLHRLLFLVEMLLHSFSIGLEHQYTLSLQ